MGKSKYSQFQYSGKYCIENKPECNLFQHTPRNRLCRKSKTCSLMDKQFIFRKNSNSVIGRKMKALLKQQENINSRSKYIVSGRRLQDIISNSTSKAENTMGNIIFKKSGDFSVSGDLGNVQKGCSQKGAHCTSVLTNRFISDGREGLGESSREKSKGSQQLWKTCTAIDATKLIKIPIILLLRNKTFLVIYLDDILFMGKN